MKVPEPIILTVGVGLYLAAVLWAVAAGPGTFMTGLLAGCGSITMGVWLGFIVVQRRRDRYLGRDDQDPR